MIPFSAVLIDLSSFHHFKPFCVHFACNSTLFVLSCSLAWLHFDPNSARFHSGPVAAWRCHNCQLYFGGNTRLHQPVSVSRWETGWPAGDGSKVLSHADLLFFFVVVQLFQCSAAQWRVQSSNANYSTSGWWELTSGDDMDSQEITVDLAGEGKCN